MGVEAGGVDGDEQETEVFRTRPPSLFDPLTTFRTRVAKTLCIACDIKSKLDLGKCALDTSRHPAFVFLGVRAMRTRARRRFIQIPVKQQDLLL